MARIRTIKPEFWSDEEVGELSTNARLLFIATWNLADDEGLLKWSPAYLKAQVFAYDDITSVEVQALMEELSEGRFVHPYKGPKNKVYGWILNFRKHQKIDRPQPPKNPLPSVQNREVKKAYAERDDWVCHICGEDVPEVTDERCKTLSLDHVKPRAKGGIDSPSNIKIAHCGCNSSKRDTFEEAPEDQSESVRGTFDEHSSLEGKGKDQGTGKGIEKPSTPKNKFSDDDMTAAEFFYSSILKIQPDYKKPNLNKWADTVRLMREQDNRTLSDICAVWAFARKDPFWQQNILSAAKLREKYDQLKAKMRAPHAASRPHHQSNQGLDPNDTSWIDPLYDEPGFGEPLGSGVGGQRGESGNPPVEGDFSRVVGGDEDGGDRGGDAAPMAPRVVGGRY